MQLRLRLLPHPSPKCSPPVPSPRGAAHPLHTDFSFRVRSSSLNYCIPYELNPVAGPFTPTPALQAHLETYILQYGAAGRTNRQWPDDATVWRIDSDEGEECGYAWWSPRQNEPNARDISIAVFDAHAGKRAAALALQHFEEVAAASGVTALCGQVNSNLPNTGMKVRLWLARHGFRLFDRSTAPYWPHMGDGEYLTRYPHPVYLRKTIPPPPPPQPEAAPQQ